MRWSDVSFPAIVAGFLAVLVSFSGPLAIFYQASQIAHLPGDMFTSWVWGIAIGAGVAGIVLSWRLRTPIITAWSAPGTALLLTLFPALSLAEAVGAYLAAAVALLVIGSCGYVDRIMEWIPKGIASGMMAGILLPFGLSAFKSSGSQPVLVGAMIACYLLGRRAWPRYNIVLLLLGGTLLAWLLGETRFSSIHLELAAPHLIVPAWSWSAMFSLAVPLVLVTLTGQYLPGIAVLKASGYRTPVRPVIVVNSLASLAVAPVGGITIAIAAITAAMCTGRDAHENPDKRYVAGIANGVFYLFAGSFGGTIVMLFAALPGELVTALAGLALLGPILANLTSLAADDDHVEASVITFLATASGMSLFGVGSAFWGIVIGLAADRILHRAGAGRKETKRG
ncbi:MAG: benzoate/H(+) symporter BenE family transporter [Massilia sp.]